MPQPKRRPTSRRPSPAPIPLRPKATRIETTPETPTTVDLPAIPPGVTTDGLLVVAQDIAQRIESQAERQGLQVHVELAGMQAENRVLHDYVRAGIIPEAEIALRVHLHLVGILREAEAAVAKLVAEREAARRAREQPQPGQPNRRGKRQIAQAIARAERQVDDRTSGSVDGMTQTASGLYTPRHIAGLH